MRFVRQLLDSGTYTEWTNKVKAQQANGVVHTIDLIMQALSDVVTNRKPTLVRRIEFFRTDNRVGQMGNQGDNVVQFMERLTHDIQGARLESLKVEDWPPIFVLRDLRRNVPLELKLAEKIIEKWKLKTNVGESWTSDELCSYVQSYWNDVRSAAAAVGGKRMLMDLQREKNLARNKRKRNRRKNKRRKPPTRPESRA